MKKKILLLAAALMMFMGVVSASSINGDYKGNPIVKVMSNGKQLQSDEVPAMIYDGHTVVPIALLRQLGAEVTWDAESYSVNIKMPQATIETNTKNIDEIKFYNKVAERYKSLVALGTLINDFYQATSVTYNSINNFDSSKLKDREAQLLNIISTYNYELTSSKEINVEGQVYGVDLKDLNGVLSIYYAAIEEYKVAMDLLNKFNVQRSNSDSTSFKERLDSGLSFGNSALKIANPKYLEWQNKAQKK